MKKQNNYKQKEKSYNQQQTKYRLREINDNCPNDQNIELKKKNKKKKDKS